MAYKCPHCGSNIRAGASTCKECGKEVYWLPTTKEVVDMKVTSIKSQVQLRTNGADIKQIYEKLFTQMFNAVQKLWKVRHLFYNNTEVYEAVLDVALGQPPLQTQKPVQKPKPVQAKPKVATVVSNPVESVRVNDNYQMSSSLPTQQVQPVNEYDKYIEALKKNPNFKTTNNNQPNDEYKRFKQMLQQSTMGTPQVNNTGDGFEMNIF